MGVTMHEKGMANLKKHVARDTRRVAFWTKVRALVSAPWEESRGSRPLRCKYSEEICTFCGPREVSGFGKVTAMDGRKAGYLSNLYAEGALDFQNQ